MTREAQDGALLYSFVRCKLLDQPHAFCTLQMPRVCTDRKLRRSSTLLASLLSRIAVRRRLRRHGLGIFGSSLSQLTATACSIVISRVCAIRVPRVFRIFLFCLQSPALLDLPRGAVNKMTCPCEEPERRRMQLVQAQVSPHSKNLKLWYGRRRPLTVRNDLLNGWSWIDRLQVEDA